MKPTLRLYIGPAAWFSGIVLAFVVPFLIFDTDKNVDEPIAWGESIQGLIPFLAYYMYVLFLLGLDHSPREYKYVWYDKGGSVCLWFRIRRDSNQDD